MTAKRTAAALAIMLISSAAGLRGAELTVSATGATAKGEGFEAAGSFGTGEVSVKAAGLERSGAGRLLALRPDGWVSDLLKGGADRYLGDSDAVAVQFAAEGSSVLLVVFGDAPVTVPVAALGLSGKVCGAYDLVGNRFLGPLFTRVTIPAETGKFGAVAVGPAMDQPVLLAESGTLGGAAAGSPAWDTAKHTLSGAVTLTAGTPYELRILTPTWAATSASPAGGQAKCQQDGAWLRVTLTAGKSGAAAWQVVFKPQPAPSAAPTTVSLKADAPMPRCVTLTSDTHGSGIVIRRNDGTQFSMSAGALTDDGVAPATTYTYTLHTVGWDGVSKALAEAKVTTPARLPLPPKPDVYLSDLKLVTFTNGWNGDPRHDKSIEDNPIRINGEDFKRGMGVHAPAELVYALKPEYRRFTAVVGVDDEKDGAGSVRFTVRADDRELLRTPVLAPGTDLFPINVELPAGAKQLHLLVDDGGDGNGCDHADWANAGFVTGKE